MQDSLDNKNSNSKSDVFPGYRNRRLEAISKLWPGEPHRLLLHAKAGYVRQGQLWVCKCDCGTELLLSEHALRKRQVKSCGCLKKEGKQVQGLTRAEIIMKRREIRLKIKMAQNRLAYLKFTSNVQNNNEALDEVGAELRSLFSEKGHWSPSRVKERKRLEDLKRDQELRFGVGKTTLPTSAEENPT